MRPEQARESSTRAEQVIREALDEGDVRRAAAALVDAYGKELYGFLAAVHGATDASDIYGEVMVRVTAGIRGFRGESAARTWLYQVARNEAYQLLRRRRRARAVFTPLERHPSAEERAHSSAEEPGREEHLARLRARLSDDDRALLALRVDRGFSYASIARMMSPAADEAAQEREAARLRQRLRAIALRLRAWREEQP